jgi:hypothetical protein
MKKISIAVAVVLLAGAANTRAQTNAFVVSVKGTVTQTDGTKVVVKDLSKGVSGLVSSTNNDLVVIVSRNDNMIEIDEVNPLTTNIVHNVAASARMAILDSGAFSADLGSIGLGVNGAVTSFPTNVPHFAGDLQASGKLSTGTKPGTSATLSGSWNDPVNGDTNQAAALFKGTIKSIATNPVPANCCTSF